MQQLISNTFSTITNGETAIDVPQGADISQLGLTEVLDTPDIVFPPIPFSKLNEKGSLAAFLGVGCFIQGPGGQGIGKGLWNEGELVTKECEPGQAHTVAETPTKECLDRRMGHVTPLVAQEVEKGFVMGMQLESMPSSYPIVDKPWVDGLSQCKMPFEGDPELLAVCEPAENSRADVKGGMDKGGGIFKG